MVRTRPYRETLKENLADPRFAAAYLTAALEDADASVFLLALKDVANVHGGMAKLAETTSLNRESLYRMLSEDGNPRISSLTAILQALGLKLSITPEKSKRSAA
jgi:probable addiction module antidote protein